MRIEDHARLVRRMSGYAYFPLRDARRYDWLGEAKPATYPSGASTTFSSNNGKVVGALDLSGTTSSSTVTLARLPTIVTVACWLRWDAFAQNFAAAWSLGGTFNADSVHAFVPNNGGGDAEILGCNAVSYGNWGWTRFTQGAWTHFVVGIDRTKQLNQATQYVYQNAASVGSASGAGVGTAGFTNATITIGGGGALADGDCAIRDISIHAGLLSAGQVAALYAAG